LIPKRTNQEEIVRGGSELSLEPQRSYRLRGALPATERACPSSKDLDRSLSQVAHVRKKGLRHVHMKSNTAFDAKKLLLKKKVTFWRIFKIFFKLSFL
jgi:hypothetical protein